MSKRTSIGVGFISIGSSLMGVSMGQHGILSNPIASVTSGGFIAGVLFVVIGYYLEYGKVW